MAELAQEPNYVLPLTKNALVLDPVLIPDAAEQPEPIELDYWQDDFDFERYSDADSKTPFWSNPMQWVLLPDSLLWTPPLANQRAPRMYGKFTTLNNESTIDTAIGGEFGLIRWAPKGSNHDGFQVDGFAAVFTRFNQKRLLVTADYRVGVPVTYAKGPWSAKLSYEHTSTHLGDEFIHARGAVQVPHVRDEIVLGLARLFRDELRVYGQIGLSFNTSDIIRDDIDRYDWGIEWSRNRATGWKGQPFAAFDMDLRSDQNYAPNTTVQIGWQWKKRRWGNSARLALEYYNGKSPYGQFFLDNESWIGIGGFFDW